MKTVHITTHYPRVVYWHGSGKDLTCLDIFKKQTPNNSGVWEDIRLVDDPINCDYVATIHRERVSEREILADHPNKMFFPYEPGYVKQELGLPFLKNYNSIFQFSLKNGFEAASWWLSYNYDYLVSLLPPEKKYKNILSIIDSGKGKLPGHQVRLKCIKQLIEDIPNQLHVHGRITLDKHKNINKTTPYKQVIPYRANESAIIPYRYYLALENGQCDYYFSERIRDCFLCWTVPIYWGCPNIDKFFPEGSYINIDPTDPNIKHVILDILNNDDYEKRLPAIAEARDLVLNKYNFVPTIKRAIDTGIIL